ncbi:Acid-sensing ion channel 5, partial [Plecturocebus cupreus]
MEQTGKSKAYAEKGFLEKIKLCLSKKPLPSPTDRKKFDHDFAISTSFHGVHNIVQNRNKIRKVLWLVVVLGSVSLVIWQIYSRLVNYFTWPTTTSIEVQYVEKMEFPAVTFCNLNRFQTDAVAKFGVIIFLWHIVSKVLHLQEITANSTDIREATDFVASHQNFSIKEFIRNRGFYLNDSTLLDCDFFGKPCSPKDFAHVFTEYGNCFTFNHGETIQTKRKVSVSGRGLRLLFNVNQINLELLGLSESDILYLSQGRNPGQGLCTQNMRKAHHFSQSIGKITSFSNCVLLQMKTYIYFLRQSLTLLCRLEFSDEILAHFNLCLPESLTLSPRLEHNGVISVHCNLCLLGLNHSSSASQVVGITGAHHHTQLIFIFLVEMECCHVGQAGLKLLTSGDLPALASQSAGIIEALFSNISSSPLDLTKSGRVSDPKCVASRPTVSKLLSPEPLWFTYVAATWHSVSGAQDAFTDSPALGFVDAGIIFAIHSPKKVPQFDGLGLLSPVGMHTRVTIRHMKMGFTMLVRLVLNSQPQVICPPWPPKCLDYRREPPCPAKKLSLLELQLT